MLENVNNVLDNKIYECDLKIVRSDSEAFIDKSKSENIMDMETYNCTQVMVQRTMSKNYVREIITGKLIPVNYIITYRDSYDGCYIDCKYLFQDSPAYILLEYEKNYIYRLIRVSQPFEDWMAAEDSKILRYFKLHPDKEKYTTELNQAFLLAEGNYQMALSENKVSAKTLIKDKLRKF